MIDNFDFEKPAIELGKLLEDSKGIDVTVLDLRSANIWTDFFVICTVTSAAHANGLEKIIREKLPELNLEQYNTSRKKPDGNEWKLIDLGGVVVHLMSVTARNFYSLEKIWYDSKNILKQEVSV